MIEYWIKAGRCTAGFIFEKAYEQRIKRIYSGSKR